MLNTKLSYYDAAGSEQVIRDCPSTLLSTKDAASEEAYGKEEEEEEEESTPSLQRA